MVPFFYEVDNPELIILASAALLLVGIGLRLWWLEKALKRKSDAFKETADHFRLIGDSLPDVATFQLTCSAEGRFSFSHLSQGCECMLGLECAQVIQDAQLVLDHVYESDISALQAAYEQSGKELTPAGLEIRILDISGTLKWLYVSAVPHRQNNAIVWDGFIQDISISKQVEYLLQEEKKNFQNLFETIDDLLLVCDVDGKLIHTNPSVKKRLGYSGQAIDSMSIFDLFPESAQEDAFRVMARMQLEHSMVCNLPLQAKDGRTVPVETNMFQGSWKNQKAIFGVARDISDHQQTEEALRESQQMLQLIIDTIPMPIFWKDRNSTYLGCNQKFIRECGLERLDEVVGKTPTDLLEESIVVGVLGREKQVLTTNQPLFNEKYSHTRTNGSMGWRNASVIPLRNDAGHAVGVLGIWRDITEQTLAEERLRRTLDDMERFNQLMRGRERRTLELKEEINRLLEKLGQPKKYKTTLESRS